MIKCTGDVHYQPLELQVGKHYKFTMCNNSFFKQTWEYAGKVIDHTTHSSYSESFCVVNDKGLIYLWNVPGTHQAINQRIYKAELLD